jgi:hypothetical protein
MHGTAYEPSQVLGDGGKNKLIPFTSRAAQSKPVEPQVASVGKVCDTM